MRATAFLFLKFFLPSLPFVVKLKNNQTKFMRIKHLTVGRLFTNCYLLVFENELAIIDPGGDADKILEEIDKEKSKVKYIINTHFHFDHTSENLKIKEKTGAKILIHENEKDFIDFEVDGFLKDGDEIKIGNSSLKIIHTPGHSSGGICLLGENILFTGDTLFKDGYGRTDLPGASQEEMDRSLKKISKLLKPNMAVYPGHGEIFKME